MAANPFALLLAGLTLVMAVLMVARALEQAPPRLNGRPRVADTLSG